MFVFIFGASGSGKSLYAEKRLLEFPEPKKIYIATAKIYDEEMRERAEKHQAARKNKGFITIERTDNLSKIKISDDSCVLIEALTTWTANEMFRKNKIKSSGHVIKKVFNDFEILKSECKNIAVVADDIFSDGIIYNDTIEEYIMTLAELTKKFASVADEVIECFAGLTLCYKNM